MSDQLKQQASKAPAGPASSLSTKAPSPGLPPIEDFLAKWAQEYLTAAAFKADGGDGAIFPFCRRQLVRLAEDLKAAGYGR